MESFNEYEKLSVMAGIIILQELSSKWCKTVQNVIGLNS